MTQLEENKMLAEFMGYKTMPDGIIRETYMDGIIANNVEELFTDYNSLIEVVEKIESKLYKVHITGTICNINGGKLNIFIKTESSKLEAIYRACVEFVKWCNEQNKNKQ